MTFHLHVTGLVQGVGFRPFVWQLARAMQLVGTVSNGVDGVHMYVNGSAAVIRQFAEQVRAEAPPLARIDELIVNEVEPQDFPGFAIVDSEAVGEACLPLTPDLALCEACRAEMADSHSRRFRYAFTTCTHCGPRYSILQRLPYDRPTTTMAPFAMCADCTDEYHNPADRRFFAQTNSCPNCPVELRLYDATGQVVKGDIGEAVAGLADGKTVAVKGIGGYLLLCDATNEAAVQTLRDRKHRPTKPLAVLYPNRALLTADCVVNEDEWALLNSPAAPIVLLRQRRTDDVEATALPSGLAIAHVAPGLSQLGVMLPYAPLLALIAEGVGKPLVATSGNVSGSPICYTNEQAISQLTGVVDLILTHNRAIVVPQDDSVVRLSPVFRQPIVIRRSRGLAPNGPALPDLSEQGGVLALGASLKSTFAWQLRGQTYVSQYLGDLESFDSQTSFRHTLDHFQSVLDAKPERLLADAHEGYFSTQLARQLAREWSPAGTGQAVPVSFVQHHEAHFAAVLAENNLLNTPEPVLGVVWDGTGYGTDGQIWGGEFIGYRPEAQQPFQRLGHFAYFDTLLGDKMPREPRLSALSLAHSLPGAESVLSTKFSPSELTLYVRLLAQNRLKTSSVGRLFDAVASLLGLADRVSYEGEAALHLEELAQRYVDRHGFESIAHYLPQPLTTPNVPTHAMIAGVLADRLANVPTDLIAARFHYTLVKAVSEVARQTGHRSLAFSGGVFQNALLVDWLHQALGASHHLFFHRQLSPNDECISFGQLSHAALTYSRQPETTHSRTNHRSVSGSEKRQTVCA